MAISFGTASMWPEQMASLIAFNRDLQKMREQFAQQFYMQGISALSRVPGSGGAISGMAGQLMGAGIAQEAARREQGYKLEQMEAGAGYDAAAQQRQYEQRKGLMNYAAQQELAQQGLLQMGAPNAETYRQALQEAGGQGNLEWQQFLEGMGQPGGAPATGAGYAPTPPTPPSYNPLPSIKSGLPMQMPSSVPFEAPYQIPDQELLSVAPPAVRDRWAQLETGQQALRQNYGTGGAYVPQISAAMSGMAAEQNQIRNRLSSQMMSPRMAGPSSFADENVEGGVFVRGPKGVEWHYEPQLARDRQAQRGRVISFTDAQGQTRTVQVPGGSAIIVDRWNPNVRYTVEPDGKLNYHGITPGTTKPAPGQMEYDKVFDKVLASLTKQDVTPDEDTIGRAHYLTRRAIDEQRMGPAQWDVYQQSANAERAAATESFQQIGLLPPEQALPAIEQKLRNLLTRNAGKPIKEWPSQDDVAAFYALEHLRQDKQLDRKLGRFAPTAPPIAAPIQSAPIMGAPWR